jgi:insulysin
MIAALISATTLVMNTMTSPISYELVEDRSNLSLLNPDLKTRTSLKLRLFNGLEVLLISDPAADQSAASISVEAGSWSDPVEYPGMAHFCEHMLFMGTKKYPSVNEFFTLVTDYAGLTNAFTAPNRTVYMFSAQTKGFLSILDRFAHFFIDPLFNPSFLTREMHNVDQEFAKNVENDGWREYMVFKETGNQNHPNRMFSTGNSETLGKIPQSALAEWHKEQYGAEKMHLVIYSPLPLEELKKAVLFTFSEVPKSQKPPVDTSGFLTSSQQEGHIIVIKPIKNRKSLTLSWELPNELGKDSSKSAEVLAYALRRGQTHSLYENLKTEGLIDSMSTRVDELGGSAHKFFQISLELTNQGIEEVETTLLRCFEAIAGLKETGVPAYLFQEKNKMAELNYQYQTRQNPFDFISDLGSTIAEEDLSTFPRDSILAAEYDASKILWVCNLLTPERCVISIMADPELFQMEMDRQEKWLGAEYAIQPIPEKWMQTLANAKPNSQIKLARPNPFVPENLECVQNGPATPLLIAKSDLGVAYYVRSPEFGTPEIVYHLHILSPELTPSAQSAVLGSLYIDHLTDALHPTLAAASAAGLSCNFDIDHSAIHLEISGYSEKAPLLLQEILKQMPENPPSPKQFAIYRDRHEKAYLNGEKELAAKQAKEVLDSIINQDKTTKKEKLRALQSIRYEDFLNFHAKLFETTYMKALFAGNLSLKEAESAFLDVVHVFGRAAFPVEEHSRTEIIHLKETGGPYRIEAQTAVQGNATILLVDQGDFSFPKRSAQEVLSAVLKEAFFNELRTKQKTGYIAQSDATEIEERLFQYFLVQSNSHGPEELLFRFEQFIEEFNHTLREHVSLERFETIKTSLIASLKTRFRNLESKSRLWNLLAFEKDEDFEFIEKRLNGLSDLSYEEFIQHANAFLSRGNKKRLAVLYQGKLHSPFAYTQIDLPQVEEVASYAPRPEKALVRAHMEDSLTSQEPQTRLPD